MSKSGAASKFSHLPRAAKGPIECPLEGSALLQSSYYNKGSAFPDDERQEFRLHGLLPPNVQTLDEQIKRAYEQYSSRPDDLAKNTFMASLKAQNEVLYYKLIQTHLKEMFSVIYTPTEGDAIQNYSRLFRRPEGCFLNIHDLDRIETSLSQFGESGRNEEIDYIVVTDGEEVSDTSTRTSFLQLTYPVQDSRNWRSGSGIDPHLGRETCSDHFMRWDSSFKAAASGFRHPRVRGEKYDSEDFGLNNARRLLDKYRPRVPCFNDDIQGTGCVTLAALMAALHVSKITLSEVRVVIFGSGSAGTGIADQITDAIATESNKSKGDAAKQIWCLDKPGLLLKSYKDKLTPAQVPFARDDSEWPNKEHLDLFSVVKTVKPHVLIGTSTRPNSFTEDIVREMGKHVERPVIFPLSNPTRLHEAQPKDINDWTEGRALIATGSPFPPVEYNGVKYEIAECNNSTCFPGIGLGAVLSRTLLLSDKMLVAAVKALAAQSPALKDPNKPLLPDVVDVREISVHIAKAVIKCAMREGLAQEKDIPMEDGELDEWIRTQMWDPEYRPLVKPAKPKST
ncbi:Malic enzyme [Rasamsonia emersonii CBS 393.64]|uniref:Malic enzyme n=1 Tax=Rasamsonia emersonii (strain ATCC 16479 / CBS 393.64 / IMI 116815) TaxID=1408163 RepID=A0A0F4Z7T3_RASE3|nr:Malic enzyme [Rasamsonia emersonii CBS 393.64]KKA25923.1 Malic enzyme [Rasamsonia emersonii CBS 393.64]